jgi:hypothetical protein
MSYPVETFLCANHTRGRSRSEPHARFLLEPVTEESRQSENGSAIMSGSSYGRFLRRFVFPIGDWRTSIPIEIAVTRRSDRDNSICRPIVVFHEISSWVDTKMKMSWAIWSCSILQTMVQPDSAMTNRSACNGCKVKNDWSRIDGCARSYAQRDYRQYRVSGVAKATNLRHRRGFCTHKSRCLSAI